MSTTSTGPDEPRRLRERLSFRRGEGRAPGLGGSGTPAPRGPVPPTETREARSLLAEADKAGRRAAGDHTLNPYVLGSVHRLPYFGRLTGLRGHARDRLVALHHEREEHELRASARLYADTAAHEQRARRARDLQAEETRRQQAAAAQLDRAAARTAAREDRRDRDAPWGMGRFTRRRTPDDPAHLDPGPGTTDGAPAGPGGYGARGGTDTHDGYDAHGYDGFDADGDDAPTYDPPPYAPAAGARWEGLTETSAMARLPRLSLTGLLVLVELPVYVTLFIAIHDGTAEGRMSAYLLSAAVGAAMAVGPFQAGRRWRRRGATASLWVVLPVAAALASVWAWAAWYLGDLRARIVFRDTPDNGMTELADQLDVELPPSPTLLQQLGLDLHTVSVTFIALLLLSGGIAFLLALSEEHPFIAAYRHHRRTLKKAEKKLAEATAAAAGARRRQETQPERARERGEALAAELAAVDAVFEAAAHAYLDGVQAASQDPAVTEGAMRLSARYPLLPEPVPSRAHAPR
ncbi:MULTISPECIES: hypothetical protein [unclassified Streptomyces]|uniref:hypothetical protein n=1 Tax=unclassified Streptomyces TaxID=2593676 RepID=UPI0038217B73